MALPHFTLLPPNLTQTPLSLRPHRKMLICGNRRGGPLERTDEIGEGDEQVTIVRIAIEEILEKAIDPRPHVGARARAYTYVCI